MHVDQAHSGHHHHHPHLWPHYRSLAYRLAHRRHLHNTAVVAADRLRLAPAVGRIRSGDRFVRQAACDPWKLRPFPYDTPLPVGLPHLPEGGGVGQQPSASAQAMRQDMQKPKLPPLTAPSYSALMTGAYVGQTINILI